MDLGERLDPELRHDFGGLPAIDFTDLARARRMLQAVLAGAPIATGLAPRVVREEIMVPGRDGAPDVRLRHHRPVGLDGQLPCLYWVHGGGHIMGSVDEDDAILGDIAATVGCAVVAVEWRHSPEHPFPAEIDDCYTGLLWTHEHGSEIEVDHHRLAVGGASSGGGSAAGLALLARDRGQVPLCFQLLVYPMLDDRNVTMSSNAITDPRVWSRGPNLLAWRHYLGDATGTDRASPYAAPSRATDLGGLPPTFISVGELDLFRDEDIDYGQRLLQADVPTEVHVYAGAYHGSDRFSPTATVSRRMVRDRRDALQRAFQPPIS